MDIFNILKIKVNLIFLKIKKHKDLNGKDYLKDLGSFMVKQ